MHAILACTTKIYKTVMSGNTLTSDRKTMHIRKIRIRIITNEIIYVDVLSDAAMYCKLFLMRAIFDVSNYDAYPMLRFDPPVPQSISKQIRYTMRHRYERVFVTYKIAQSKRNSYIHLSMQ